MEKAELLEFINQNPAFVLGTEEGNQPRVRWMMTAIADERGIIFSTGKMKDLYEQLAANPAIEMVYYSAEKGLQLRLQGVAQILDDDNLRNEIVNKFEFLKPWIEKSGLDQLIPFKISNIKGLMLNNSGPEEQRETFEV